MVVGQKRRTNGNPNANGTYTINGGSLNTYSDLFVGRFGTGRLDQTASDVNVKATFSGRFRSGRQRPLQLELRQSHLERGNPRWLRRRRRSQYPRWQYPRPLSGDVHIGDGGAGNGTVNQDRRHGQLRNGDGQQLDGCRPGQRHHNRHL